LSSYDKIKFRLNGSNKHQFDLLGAKQEEILLEFYTENEQKTQAEQFVFFQIKVIKDNRTRIITKKVAIEGKDRKAQIHDPNIIHAFALRKLSHFIYIEKNLEDAGIYLNEYKEFLKSFQSYDSRITSTVKILEVLSDINSISEMDSVTLHNNQRINSHELTSYSMISHSEIARKNTEEMKKILNDSCDQLNEIADGMNNEVDFKNKISDKLRIFDRDFMGPYTSTAVMFMVMELVDQMFMVLKNCDANEDSDQEINDSYHEAGDFDLQGENNHVESIHGLKHILLNEFGKMEKVFAKFDELQPYSESWIAQNENLIQEMFQAIVAKLEETKKSTIEISTCMTQTIVRSDKIIKGSIVIESFFKPVIF